MKFVALAEDDTWNILTSSTDITNWVRVTSIDEFLNYKNANAYFNFMEDACKNDYTNITKPIFINSVANTLRKIKSKKNVIRFNGWQGFVEKTIWEIAGKPSRYALAVLKKLKKDFIEVQDIAGFVSARVIAMIINEAFFALEANVSTKAEIDIAMKLGTNYPYGPFEWAEKIGLENVNNLLQAMDLEDVKYSPAKTLTNELKK